MNPHTQDTQPLSAGMPVAFLDWETAQSVVRDSSNDALMLCLDWLLENEQHLTHAAARSHRHQLGFMKYVLFQDPFGRSLRLHSWDYALSNNEDIHSHRVNFCSRIVSGRLTENRYDVLPGDEYSLFRYRTIAGNHSCNATADGRISAKIKSTKIMQKNEVYYSERTELHNISDVEIGTITISAWGVPNEEAIVLKEGDANANDCLASIGISPDQMREALKQIKTRISLK